MLEQLGPYLIDEQIGRGGMGFVYSARHEETDEQVAVKTLLNAFADDDTFRDRFHQEIETLQQLQHVGIVRIIGYGQEDGVLFYAMELVKGRTLFQILKETGTISWREVIRITIDVCHALKHAHDRGVIHRDLKPSNLFLTEDDEVKLVDFGIARLFGATQLTADHAVVGTADYMAPEQAEGARPTLKSDLYSLGSVMYALLTGRPPFASPSVGQIIHKLKYDQPQPITELVSDVPLELDYIVRQLLSKNPDNRIPTPLAVAHRLQAMQHALEANMPVKPANPNAELSDDSGDIVDGATMEYIPTGQQDNPNTNITIDGEYLSNIEDSDRESATEPNPDHLKQQSPEKPSELPQYTKVEQDLSAYNNDSPSGILASLIVVSLLVVGVGGLLAFTNWYNHPRKAEELLGIIEDAKLTPGSDWGQASQEMQEFLDRFHDHPQFGLVQDHYNTLRNERDEQRFLKSMEGELEQLPIATITLRQILDNETLSSEETITQLKYFVTIYDARQEDKTVVDCVTIARNKIERLKTEQTEVLKQRENILAKTELEIREVMDFCRTIAKNDKQEAVESLNALYEIHKLDDELSNVLDEVIELKNQLSE